MKHMPTRRASGYRIWASGSIAVAALWSCSAFAALGEPESSLSAESQLARGSINETDHGEYRVHEILLPSGTLVREYAGADGNVFAVTWRGPFMPSLKQMLGRYFDEYAAAARAGHGDRKHLEVRQSNLVVQASGHMRAYSGRAYLPQALPSGVSPGDLE
jgi:Protein of unknown function (DUF2844)